MREASSARRSPAQARSRERMERILSVATDLIARSGSDALKMSDVAAGAEISIGSLYQYFPDKAAIIRMLAERNVATSRQCIAEALEKVRDVEELKRAFASLVDQYYGMFLASPVMRDIIFGMQADKDLMTIELAESRASGALLTEVMTRVHAKLDASKVAASSFLIWQLGEHVMRLAVSVDRAEGDKLVEAYKRMMLREIAQPGG
ncbi:HTH-type transcriptional repressor Bm3R1 [Variibacter gotjawalensis]|uniref:HTH-type transcriptional repressor Bm3R1 n=2 Tax=Variibacter gotjawalensis TaxID=1333996 RepID=A0A0S3PZP8_9BRAD|nr:TetR family transcriptional regulator [Variibacter gotjawalensis]BAT61407.1 HTH-type transcriptional repressor Bm3R1 [Variibacter gotjawalensis]